MSTFEYLAERTEGGPKAAMQMKGEPMAILKQKL